MSRSRKITIAACQHDVSDDISKNLSAIREQIVNAKSREAQIVHFSECNLTGYGGIDLAKITKEDFGIVEDAISAIQEQAKELQIGVIFGCHFFVAENEKPRNALFYVNKDGAIGARYDKRILAGAPGELDHKYYSSGDQPGVFEINGIKCGLLICHEWRYPEFYREYKRLGVDILFHSWYDGSLDESAYLSEGKHAGELIVGYVKGNAANNYMWISGSNTSKRESCFPSFIARPDGRIAAKLTRNEPGALICTLDLEQQFEDPSYFGRQRFI